ALFLLARVFLETAALGREVGERCCEIAENLLGGAKSGIRLGCLGVNTTTAARALSCFVADGFFFAREPRNGLLCIGSKPLLPLGIGGKLNKPQIELRDAVLGARFFPISLLPPPLSP